MNRVLSKLVLQSCVIYLQQIKNLFLDKRRCLERIFNWAQKERINFQKFGTTIIVSFAKSLNVGHSNDDNKVSFTICYKR